MEKRSVDENYHIDPNTGEIKPNYKTERQALDQHFAFEQEFNAMYKKSSQGRDKL